MTKFFITYLLSFHFINTLLAQAGCTDPFASNYNPNATSNDGSCVYPATSASAVFKANLPGVAETSGLVWSAGSLWTHEDSGGPATIYQLDTATGAVVKSIIVDNFPNVDWEDITADDSMIYVAETGNNNGNRTDLKILKIKKADIGSGATVHVNAAAINFSYADQTDFTPSTTTNFDCEAITVVHDSIYLFTKNWGDLNTRLYVLPKNAGTYSVAPRTSHNVGCLVTGATYSAAKKEITLIGYNTTIPPVSSLWILNDYQPGGQVFSGNKRKITLTYSSIWQTEGIAYVTDNDYFISTEAISQLSLPAKLFRLSKSWLPTTSVKELMPGSYSSYPNPVLDKLVIKGIDKGMKYVITDMSGKVLTEGTATQEDYEINTSGFAAGTYVLELFRQGKKLNSSKFVKH
ncbi:MAG TPA: T9SS type A sorting domain-containing protein [Flavipsychrobacter sp.]|nr:T9SS type A sorting domain-containing protein [Flavipsychrobacter sp.]